MRVMRIRRLICLTVPSILTMLFLSGCVLHSSATTPTVASSSTSTTMTTGTSPSTTGTTAPTVTSSSTTTPATSTTTDAVVTTGDACVYSPDIVFVREPRMAGYLPQLNFMTCVEEGVVYFFSDHIATGDRNEFVAYQETLMSFLETSRIPPDRQVGNYIFEDVPSRSDSAGRKAFFILEDAGTYMQVLITLQSSFGDYSNYGWLYGLSNRIAAELGWETDVPDISIHDVVEFTEGSGNQEYLDLTYPCFVSSYVGDALPFVKAVACILVNGLIDDRGISSVADMIRLQDAAPSQFDAEAVGIMNDWLSSIGSATRVTARETPIRFAYGGMTAPILASTEHATYYLLNVYSEASMDMMEIDYFKSDYAHLIEAFSRIEDDMAAADLVYRDPERVYRPLSIVLCDEKATQDAARSIAYYSIPHTTVYSASVWPVNHEYLHYLTTPTVGYNWQYEAIADYGNSSSYFLRLFYQRFFEAMIRYNWDGLEDMRGFLGRDPQADDFPTYCDMSIVVSGDFTVSTQNGLALISVPNYVRITYGEKVMNRIFIHQNTIEAEISLTWAELIEEWQQWLIDTYGYLS
ncbi:MAG: hypothetical protein WC509_00135 [Candidatus Izemoplasmatales bacterium]